MVQRSKEDYDGNWYIGAMVKRIKVKKIVAIAVDRKNQLTTEARRHGEISEAFAPESESVDEGVFEPGPEAAFGGFGGFGVVDLERLFGNDFLSRSIKEHDYDTNKPPKL
jgi:hypothetical protein